MAGTNTASSQGTLTVSLPTVLSRFYLLEQERGKLINCATREVMPPHTGSAYNYINYGLLTAFGATDGVDAAQAQALRDTKTSYSPGEVVVNVVVSDRTVARVADPSLLAKVGEMCMRAIELKEDQDGCNKFSSFTPTLGSTGTVHTVGHLFAAEAALRMGSSTTTPEPAPLPWFAIMHPYTLAATAVKLLPLSAAVASSASAITSAAAGAGVLGAAIAQSPLSDIGMKVLMGKGLLRQLDMGEIFVIADANCPYGVSAATDAYTGYFSKEGLIFVSEVTPYMRQERDESLRGVEITAVTSYAWGVYRASAYGVLGTFDATAPTS